MGVSLFFALTLLSLCLHTSTSELLQFQLSTISAAPSFLPEAPSASPPEAMSPDISPLFPTPGSSEMSPSPSDSSEMPTIPSSLSPPNPDAVGREPLLDTSPLCKYVLYALSVSDDTLFPLLSCSFRLLHREKITLKMLYINLFPEEKRNDPEISLQSQRRRFASVEVVDKINNLDKAWRQGTYLIILRIVSILELDLLANNVSDVIQANGDMGSEYEVPIPQCMVDTIDQTHRFRVCY
ncbi:unnamed protein product [Eruca vesicaria subsp. sativa]|uniref:Uncharacterized protein n=1 Tax=Eruca vesicaria subsp. sativa TaxID=29727 RepID=A0ABC8JHS4_ERUVS|nr:unnamed protein product [Eruca vesicaria subsp. sativa]